MTTILLAASALSVANAQNPTAPSASQDPATVDESWQKASSKYDSQRATLLRDVDKADQEGPFRPDWESLQRNIGDQFLFGPSILVSPVLKENSTQRSVYLPQSKLWYDFWAGTSLEGSREVDAQAPIDPIPLFVRAGSLIPLGPEVQYANEKPEGPIELRVYSGADGSFDLYQDAGDTYEYEKGARAIIPLRWSEAGKTLTIGQRQGRVSWSAEGYGIRHCVGSTWTRHRREC